MKKLFLLLAALPVLSSCSPVDDNPDSPFTVIVSVISAKLPKSFTLGQEPISKFRHSPLTRCHEFHKLDHEQEGKKFFSGIANTFSPNDLFRKEEVALTAETSFSFTFETNDFYIFNFWHSQN